MTKPASKGRDTRATGTDLVATTRDRAAHAGQDATALIAGNPLAALLGGIALGAAAGVLVPRGDRERALLAPLGARLAAAATAALGAGREAGTKALDDSGLTIDGLRDQVGNLFRQAASAATTAGSAAFAAAKDAAADQAAG